MSIVILHLLVLLGVANGAPVIARKLLPGLWGCPVDAGYVLPDGRPLFGASKTVRGVVASLGLTALAAPAFGVPVPLGVAIALWAMIGDLLASFVKRRLGMAPSSMALGLDQIPESLLPLLAVRDHFDLSWQDIVVTVALFIVLELLLSRLLYRLDIRKRPY